MVITTQYGFEDITNLTTILDWEAINTKYWRSETDLDLKRRKEAEFLVRADIPIEAVLGYIVYNESAKEKLKSFGIQEKKIIIKSDCYF